MRLLSITFLLAGLFTNTAAAQKPAGNLESVMNAFISSIAKDSVALKADIRMRAAGEAIPPGFQYGTSTALGEYYFRPKSWGELADGEKAQVLQDGRLKAFIVSMRNAEVYPVLSSANANAKFRVGQRPVEGVIRAEPNKAVVIPAEEMIKNRPIVISIE